VHADNQAEVHTIPKLDQHQVMSEVCSEDHEVEEWSAPQAGQDLAQPMVTHQPDVKKRSRIRDELFQGLMKVCIDAGMAMHASEAVPQGLP